MVLKIQWKALFLSLLISMGVGGLSAWITSGGMPLYEELAKHDARVKVVTYEGAFNFSKIVNYGVSQSSGELVLILNNDTKAITDGFLDIMAGYFERPEVGVVGPMLR